MLDQLGVQVTGVLATGGYTAVLTFVLLKVIDGLIGLRVSDEEEIEGLDINEHNERGYDT
jgi:Amt family ammonium transporter